MTDPRTSLLIMRWQKRGLRRRKAHFTPKEMDHTFWETQICLIAGGMISHQKKKKNPREHQSGKYWFIFLIPCKVVTIYYAIKCFKPTAISYLYHRIIRMCSCTRFSLMSHWWCNGKAATQWSDFLFKKSSEEDHFTQVQNSYAKARLCAERRAKRSS